MDRILIYGYGNPGREDDGLGIAFADAMQKWSIDHDIKNLSFEVNYQLNIEDALEISKYDLVMFADASQEEIDHFQISEVVPSQKVNFNMHSVSPSYVGHLCSEIFNKNPKTLLIHLKGYQWEMKEGLSKGAVLNLEMALTHVQAILKNPETMENQLLNFPEVTM